jgi:multimeric flavodoxin WrbA
MKILGISGSPRNEKESGTIKIVKAVLDATGLEYELVSLRGKKIAGCIACLGCVNDNICKIEDDMTAMRQKIVEADAYVIGAPNYYSGANAATCAFLERWFQFRHKEGSTLWGKLAVAVGVGGMHGDPPADEIEKFLAYNLIETVDKISVQGRASCYNCGSALDCKVGIPYFKTGGKVTQKDLVCPDPSELPEVMELAEKVGKNLADRLLHGHDRRLVAKEMQMFLMDKLSESA